ncbi:MAG: glutamine synthetase family protein [Candidatus Lokiarchaeia archaeon]
MQSEEELKQKVLEKTKSNGINIITLQFVDIFGTAKTCAIPTRNLEDALDNGIGFDGSSVEGFARIYESDMRLIPDPSSFTILSPLITEKKVATIFCDVYLPEGKPFEGDPRYILRKNLEEAKKMGFNFYVGPELEFFLFKLVDGVEPVPQDHGGYFDLAPLDLAFDVRGEAAAALEDMGIEVELDHHEVAPGQHEIDFKYGDALHMADAVTTYKYVIKAIAKKHSLFASFMPKPLFGINGSGMHVHQSLWTRNKNAFFDKNGKYSLSETAFYFIGGQLKYIKEIISVLAPTVNSYKRLVPGYEAPVYICWARRNRSALIRVPEYYIGREKAIRAELRCPDSSTNPYLAFAVMLKAGIEGIKNEIEPAEPVDEDVYEFNNTQLKEFYIDQLPGSLGEAIALTEKSEIVKEALGEHVFTRFIEGKRKEWKEFQMAVTNWELSRYLAVL